MYRPSVVLGLLAAAGCSCGLDLDVNDANSIKSAAKAIVANIINYYGDAQIPGLFSGPQYFFEDGLTWDALVNYWALTGDDSYVNLTHEALMWQVGADNYMPANQSLKNGNNDQSTWGLAAMTAAERGFPAPSGNISWAQLAQNVFDSQAQRWDTETCGGGLHWQIYLFNPGYDYKNSISNGNFAQLAARLARFTGNQTYNDWASKSIEWSQKVGLITSKGNVFDGAVSTDGCKSPNKVQWTSNSGTYIAAAAFMSNTTGSDASWDLLESVFSTANEVFTNSIGSSKNVLVETACAPQKTCSIDQYIFRAILARALTVANALTATSTSSSAPALHSNINSILQASAQGAAAQCSGGRNSTVCGNDWTSSKWDGDSGLGPALSALEIILANLPAAQLATSNSSSSASSPPTDPNTTNTNTTTTTTTTTTNTTTSTPTTGDSPANSSAAGQASDTNAATSVMSSAFLPLMGLALAALL